MLEAMPGREYENIIARKGYTIKSTFVVPDHIIVQFPEYVYTLIAPHLTFWEYSPKHYKRYLHFGTIEKILDNRMECGRILCYGTTGGIMSKKKTYVCVYKPHFGTNSKRQFLGLKYQTTIPNLIYKMRYHQQEYVVYLNLNVHKKCVLCNSITYSILKNSYCLGKPDCKNTLINFNKYVLSVAVAADTTTTTTTTNCN